MHLVAEFGKPRNLSTADNSDNSLEQSQFLIRLIDELILINELMGLIKDLMS